MNNYKNSYENARILSTVGKPVKRNKKSSKIIQIKIALFAMGAACFISAGLYMKNVSAELDLYDNYTSQYVDMFNKEVKRTSDNQHYYYEYNDLARSILNSDDPDAFLYVAYQHMNNESYLDELIKRIDQINGYNNIASEKYEDWDGYIESLGYNKKSYSSSMMDEIVERAKEEVSKDSKVVR